MEQEQEETLAEAARLLGEALSIGPQASHVSPKEKVQVGNVMRGDVTIHNLTQNFS